MIYLASPYSAPYEAARERRFLATCEATASLIERGVHVFSPIVHSHHLTRYGISGGFSAWREYDREMILLCRELWVLMLFGWEHSEGIKEEIEHAKKFGKEIRFLAFGDALSKKESVTFSPPTVLFFEDRTPCT